MPEVGFEPTRSQTPRDFESRASTSFTTPALFSLIIEKKHEFCQPKKAPLEFNHSQNAKEKEISEKRGKEVLRTNPLGMLDCWNSGYQKLKK